MDKKTEWLQVGQLANGFVANSNALSYVNDLAGLTLDISMDNGWLIRHEFTTNNRLTWQILEGRDKGERVEESYTATSIREGIYFIDFIKSKEKSTTVSLVVNLATGNGTAIINTLPSRKETMRSAYQRVIDGDTLTPVKTNFVQFSVNKPYVIGLGHQLTNELVGKRIQYTYSPHESYEHIYLNPNYYTWQCLNGVEKGLADTDLCHYYKIENNLYLFVWREKIIPTAGVIMIDLTHLKTTGKIVGFENSDFGIINNFPVGAFVTLLNETEHTI